VERVRLIWNRGRTTRTGIIIVRALMATGLVTAITACDSNSSVNDVDHCQTSTNVRRLKFGVESHVVAGSEFSVPKDIGHSPLREPTFDGYEQLIRRCETDPFQFIALRKGTAKVTTTRSAMDRADHPVLVATVVIR
jgi:hypothetical protein